MPRRSDDWASVNEVAAARDLLRQLVGLAIAATLVVVGLVSWRLQDARAQMDVARVGTGITRDVNRSLLLEEERQEFLRAAVEIGAAEVARYRAVRAAIRELLAHLERHASEAVIENLFHADEALGYVEDEVLALARADEPERAMSRLGSEDMLRESARFRHGLRLLLGDVEIKADEGHARALESLSVFAAAALVGLMTLAATWFHVGRRWRRVLIDLESANYRARAMERAKDQLLTNVSHELRTPLNILLGNLELLEDAALDKESASMLDAAKIGADELERLLENLMAFAQLAEGTADVQFVEFEPRKALESIEDVLFKAARRKGLAFDVVVGANVPAVLTGDARRWSQVLVELLGNAVKFTSRGRVRLDVELDRVEAGCAVVRSTVTDTGPGFPRGLADRALQPFTLGDGSMTREHGGVGLGLALVRETVGLLGGKLEVGSTAEGGARAAVTCTFGVPEEVLAAPERERVEDRVDRDEAAPAAPLHVLVVEDNMLNQRVAMRLLETLGMQVSVAATGLEALQRVAEARFDLILMDCQMPEMDGYTATREIRRRETGGHVPIVALTANALEGDRARCLDAGMDDFLKKPAKRDQLFEVVERWARRAS